MFKIFLFCLLVSFNGIAQAESLHEISLNSSGHIVEIAHEGDYHYMNGKLIKFTPIDSMSADELGYIEYLGDGYLKDNLRVR